ncbi:hypothetical protein V2G26_007234 [Clonostachys chloroleuca]
MHSGWNSNQQSPNSDDGCVGYSMAADSESKLTRLKAFSAKISQQQSTRVICGYGRRTKAGQRGQIAWSSVLQFEFEWSPTQ